MKVTLAHLLSEIQTQQIKWEVKFQFNSNKWHSLNCLQKSCGCVCTRTVYRIAFAYSVVRRKHTYCLCDNDLHLKSIDYNSVKHIVTDSEGYNRR